MDVVEQRTAFSLSALPREMLTLILAPVDSYLVIPLYLAGDKTLNHKIETGGCVEVRLLDRKMDSKSRFPSLLKNLTQLRRLSITKFGTLLYPFSRLSQALQELSPTLQTLEIDCVGCYEALLRLPDPIGSSSALLAHFAYPKGPSCLWNIGECFPMLQDLRFGRKVKRNFLSSIAPFQLSDLVVLPDTLHHLSINLPFHDFKGDLSTTLPQNLQNLEVNNLDTSAITGWPPNLVSLSRMYLGPFLVLQSQRDYANLGQTPRTLTEITFGTNPIANPLLMASVPPNVRRLKCVTADEPEFDRIGIVPWSKALPSRLTSIDIDSAFNYDALASLPRTVTSLSAAIDIMDISDKLCIPDPNLDQRCRLKRDETMLEISIRQSSLDYASPTTSSPLDLSFWPPALKTLGMLWKIGYEVSFEEQISILPKTLKKLSLRVGEGSYAIRDNRYASHRYFWLHNLHIKCPKLQKFSIFSTHDRPIYFRWPLRDTRMVYLHLDGNYTGAMYDLSKSRHALPVPQPPLADPITGELDRSTLGLFEPFLVPETVSGFGLDIWRLRDALRILTTALPRTLRRLLFRSGNSSDMRFYFTPFLTLRPAFFNALPPNLLEINFDAAPPALPSCLNFLPKSVTSLMLELRGEFTELPILDRDQETRLDLEMDSIIRSPTNQDGFNDSAYDSHDFYDRYLIEGDEGRDLIHIQDRLSNGSFTLSKIDLLQFGARCPKLTNYWPLLDTVPLENWNTLTNFWPRRTLSHVVYHHDISEYPEPLQEAANLLWEYSVSLPKTQEETSKYHL